VLLSMADCSDWQNSDAHNSDAHTAAKCATFHGRL